MTLMTSAIDFNKKSINPHVYRYSLQLDRKKKVRGEQVAFPISPGHSLNTHIDGKVNFRKCYVFTDSFSVKQQNIQLFKADPILKCYRCSFYILLEFCKNM